MNTATPPKSRGPVRYRILRADRSIKYAGTGQDSWFTLQRAKELVDHSCGEMVYEFDYEGNRLWEAM